MTIQASYLIAQVAEQLQDATFVRWKVPELARYLMDGRREILVSRPDATAQTLELTLSEGAVQTLPVAATKLLEVRRNSGASKRAVTQCPLEMLDAVAPEWAAMTPSTEIRHFTFDPRTPREFHVYPPAADGTKVMAVCSVIPADLTVAPGATQASGVTGDAGVPDILVNALMNYVLYRAYAKDSESPSSMARAQAYYNAFAAGLGTEVTATVTAGPTSRPTPMSST